MDGKSYTELLKILRDWQDDFLHHHWRPKAIDNAEKVGKQMKEPVPVENRENWCKAMCALAEYDVLSFHFYDSDGNDFWFTDEMSDDPKDKYYYTITDFKLSALKQFCNDRGIDLLGSLETKYTATLSVQNNTVYVKISNGKSLRIKTMNDALPIQILKIAMTHPGQEITASKINRYGLDADLMKKLIKRDSLVVNEKMSFTQKFKGTVFDAKRGALNDFIDLKPDHITVYKYGIEVAESRIIELENISESSQKKRI